MGSATAAGVGQLEVDAFCSGCHYNLHGQIVTVDEHLGIPVCRCPECGKFHAAGAGVTANSVWLRRAATTLLFVWIVVIVAFCIGEMFALGGMQTASVEAYTQSRFLTADGKPAEQKIVNGKWVAVEEGTDIIAKQAHWVRTLRPWYGSEEPGGPGVEAMLFFSGISMSLAYLAGVLCVSLLWHWPPGRYFWSLLLVVVPFGFLLCVYGRSDEYVLIRGAAITRIAVQALLQAAALVLGLLMGRKIARAAARVCLPPKPRQALAFLWLVDGKPPPAVMLAEKVRE